MLEAIGREPVTGRIQALTPTESSVDDYALLAADPRPAFSDRSWAAALVWTVACPQVRIDKQLGVLPAEVSRDVRRNGAKTTYKAVLADQQSDVRQRSAYTFCEPKIRLHAHLPVWLEQGFSPEQIGQRLKLERPDQAVSHEWIYRFIDVNKWGGGLLYLTFRRRPKRYRKCYASFDQCGQSRVDCQATWRSRNRASGWETERTIWCMA